MFKRILIANRGEIACRIIKTARSMGIETIAIYSAVDQDCLHVQLADQGCYVGGAAAKDSYLNIDQIIKVAKESGAEAIHPGYGFLSENPEFAKACATAGIVFIGPTVAAMEAMASKQLAKQLLEKTSVPLTPGYHGKDQSPETLQKEAKKIGFPVLIKAANGGGGKGMRQVNDETEFHEALAAAKREAMASFAVDTMIIEKRVVNPRHIEVQIMADQHGQVVHLFERDCSIQRRHQKIIEEAPAPHLSPTLRAQLTEAACTVARSIQYLGAGTVEFLVDGEDRFYFMEMNTRLQVEHPITELITGLDLVAWQLKIAANQPLPLNQKEIQMKGHAIECRICAEDPSLGFIPSIGVLQLLREPVGDGIRIDTGVIESSAITQFYDPMIAKLIAWGADRNEALNRMKQALSHFHVGGVKTNIQFLNAICQHPKFIQGLFSIDFLSQEALPLPTPNQEQALIMTVAFDYLNCQMQVTDPLRQDTFAWQMQGLSSWLWRYHAEDELIEALVMPVDKKQFKLRLNYSKPQNIKPIELLISADLTGDDSLTITANNQRHQAIIANTPQCLSLFTQQGVVQITRFQWSGMQAAAKGHKGQLTAPMPATVVAILKKIGEEVKAGEPLIILEAMKMEHTVHAPVDGKLSAIFFAVGAQVNEGAELLALHEP